MNKPSKDLHPGDKVKWSDAIDTVVSVEDSGGCVLKVNVIRRGQKTFFYAGKESVQEVEP